MKRYLDRFDRYKQSSTKVPRGFAGIMFTLSFSAGGSRYFTPVFTAKSTNYRFLGDRFDYGVTSRDILLSNLKFLCARSSSNLPGAAAKTYVRRSTQSFVTMFGRGSSVGSLSFRSVLGIARVMSRYNGKLARSGGWWGPYAINSVNKRHTAGRIYYNAAPYAAKVTPLGRNSSSKILRHETRRYRKVSRYKRLWRSLKNMNPNRVRRNTRPVLLPPAVSRMYNRFMLKTMRKICHRSQFRTRGHRTEFRVKYRKCFWAGVALRYAGARRFPRHWNNTIKYVTVRSQKTKWFARRQGSMNWRINSRKFGAFRTGSMYGGSIAYVAGVASGSSWSRGFKFRRPFRCIFIKKTTSKLYFRQNRHISTRKSTRRWGRNLPTSYRVALRGRLMFHRARARVHALLAAASQRWSVLGQIPDADANMSIYRLMTYCGFSAVSSLDTVPFTTALLSSHKKRRRASFIRSDRVALIYGDGLGNGRAHGLSRWFTYIVKKKDLAIDKLDRMLDSSSMGKRTKKANLPFSYRNKVITAAETYLAKGIISQAQTMYTSRFGDLLKASFAADGGMSHAMWDHTSRSGFTYNNYRPSVGYVICNPRFSRNTTKMLPRLLPTLVTYPNNPKGYYAVNGENFSPTLPVVQYKKALPVVRASVSERAVGMDLGRAWSLVPTASLATWDRFRRSAISQHSANTVRYADRAAHFGYLSTLNIQEGRLLWYLGTPKAIASIVESRKVRYRLRRLNNKQLAKKVPVTRAVRIRAVLVTRGRLRLPRLQKAPTSLTLGELTANFLDTLDMRRNTPWSRMLEVLSARQTVSMKRRKRRFWKNYKYRVIRLHAMKRFTKIYRYTTSKAPQVTGTDLAGSSSRVWVRRTFSDTAKPAPKTQDVSVLFATASRLAAVRPLLPHCRTTHISPVSAGLLGNLNKLRAFISRVKRVTRNASHGRPFRMRRMRTFRRLVALGRTHNFSSGLTLAQFRLQKRVDGAVSGSALARDFFKAAAVPTYLAGRARILVRAAKISNTMLLRARNAVTEPKVARSRMVRGLQLHNGEPTPYTVPYARRAAPQRLPRQPNRNTTPRTGAKHEVVIQPYPLAQGQRAIGPDGYYIKKSTMEVRRGGYFGDRGVKRPMHKDNPRNPGPRK